MKVTPENVKYFLCLGILIDNHWRCGSRKISKVYTAKDSPSKSPMIGFMVPGPGVYAVIFRPSEVSI